MSAVIEFDVLPAGMEITKPLPPFIQSTPTGLVLAKDLTFDEWNAIGSGFGTAVQTAAWCIGDWLVYGEKKWGSSARIPSEGFDLAVAATNLDRQTLSKYAEVCRKIPREERRISLSFGHHRILAPLPSPQRLEWLNLLTDLESVTVPTVKRLALSVRIADEAPRIVTDEEIVSRGVQCGHDNYIPHLVRLLTVLRKTLPGMDEDQREALKEDTEQLLAILESL